MASDPSTHRMPEDAVYASALRALGNAEWQEACAGFRSFLERVPDEPAAWEGLAAAAWWVPDEEAIFEAREKAFHLYRQRDNRPRAALMASWLAVDSVEMRGQPALANGWIQRANRLLEGCGEAPERAWVTNHQARLLQMLGGSAADMRRTAARSATLARKFGLPDVEALGLTLQGHARLSEGDVTRAERCLDEAAAVVLGGEVHDLTAAALTLCSLMSACERIRDFDRAHQWCTAARRFSEERGFPVVLSVCRPHYGAVLMWRGEWPEAEEHLETGRRELLEFVPEFAVGAIALLGALRWRQGRWDDAEAILHPIKHEGPAQVPYAELLASRGDPEAAADLLQRYLRIVSDKLERASTLELLVRCLAALREPARAASHLRELREIADAAGTQSLRAATAFAEGLLARSAGNLEEAQDCLGDSVSLFERAGAPFESARARLELAEVMRAGGRYDAAMREAGAAHEKLTRIGATKEAERARRLHEAIEAQRAAVGRSSNGLTPREEEILQLLAQGRSNQEIAASLVLSVRTVERHISNIYEKLGLEGRTARTAAAARAYETAAKSARPR